MPGKSQSWCSHAGPTPNRLRHVCMPRKHRQVLTEHVEVMFGTFSLKGQRCGADWDLAAPSSPWALLLQALYAAPQHGCAWSLGRVRGHLALCCGVADGHRADGSGAGCEAGAKPGLGKEQWGLRMDKGAENSAGDHWSKTLIRIEKRELWGNICQYLPGLLLCSPPPARTLCTPTPSLCPPSSVLHPQGHTLLTAPPQQYPPPGTPTVPSPPPLQELLAHQRLRLQCLYSPLTAWEEDRERLQEQAAHSKGTLKPLVIAQRELYSRCGVHGEF